jgi:tetratricopeptide (TPR) repeat protein
MRTPGFNARAIVAALVITFPALAQVADGDRLWEARANGTIDGAIAAYSRAVAANANDLVAHARLLRAYRFKGAYVAKSNEEKKKVYATAKSAGEKALAAVASALKSHGVKPDAPEKSIAAAIRTIPGAADVYLWDAINWGEWALAYGKMAAARQGAADRIKRGATIAHLADPRLENGSPSRVLGRLHDQTPRIPFITGWASSKEAVRFLEESRKYDPSNKLTAVFLAEALVANDSGTKARAIQLLKEAIAAPVDPKFRVEDAAAIADAKALLKKWGA